MRNITEKPDKWVIIKISYNVPINGKLKKTTYYKVFASWYNDDKHNCGWLVNSGIAKIEQDVNYYYFTGFSGSCYKCHKQQYGVANSYNKHILNRILEQADNRITLMKNKDDWSKIIK